MFAGMFICGLWALGMRRLRQAIGLLAIIAIALHGVLFTAASLAAAATDPFAVICHSNGQASPTDDQSPTTAPHGCDHCTLCNATLASITVDDVFAGQLMPVRILHVLRPASVSIAFKRSSIPKLSQGPPAFA